ncbi:MAG: hypothetical protein LBT05_06815 [Planctomycetaceae bacterium]|jgi:hypothetical protein|nr:hypothetical protein [Planctomycetaceae bacterium]
MKTYQTLTLTIFLTFGMLHSGLLFAEDIVSIPPLKIAGAATQGAAAGNWKAATPPAALDYDETKKLAFKAEADGDAAKALTLWERVLDRTTCREEQRSEARAHVKELRPKVQINADVSQAKKWNVLVLIYKELKADKKNQNGSTISYRQAFIESDLETIGRELAGFRDMVFEWSGGILLPEFDVTFVSEPITNVEIHDGFPIGPAEVEKEFKKASDKKTYNTVISYVKFRDAKGPNLPRPWTAAMYGRLPGLHGAGYMMIPWGDDYPFKREVVGEMELHEWLHQIDDLVHDVLGYPRGTTRSPDDGRGVNDSRQDGEQEYKKPDDCPTWTFFYKHLTTEHLTRQIWSEMTTRRIREGKPGAIIQITP